MKLHEFQAKALLKKYGVPVPEGQRVETPLEACQLVDQWGGKGVVKAQIYAGGRGKAGGVKVVSSKAEAEAAFDDIMDKVLVTPQTGPEGRRVGKILVEQALDIKDEYYLSILVDRAQARLAVLASAEGGTEIEEVAAASPEKIITLALDPVVGYTSAVGREIGFALGLDGALVRQFDALLKSMVAAFTDVDASLIEINPLVVTGEGKIVAADAKVTLDDSALFRHKDLAELDDQDESDPLEWEARKHGLNYIRLDGTIGAMVNGAGLAMATMDLIKQAGAEPANFLDAGGGANKDMIAQGFRIILSDKRVKAILVNIFGGILRCDTLASGVVAAAKEIGLPVPLIVRLSGTNAAEGREILNQSGLEFLVAEDMSQAAQLVAAQAGGAK